MKFIYFLKINLLFIIFCNSLLCQNALEPININSVMVKGNNLTTSSVIKYTSGLVEGQKVVPGDFGKSVKKLWATGFFSNIEINLERETLNGIDLIIIVEETPILGEIIFKGDKK